jgi:hypothetical protein
MSQQQSTFYYDDSESEVEDPSAVDMAAVQRHRGVSVAKRVLGSRERYTLSFTIDGVINASTAQAWGISPTQQIAVDLNFNTLFYTNDSKPPAITITQEGKEFPLGQQLRRMLEDALRHQWNAGRWVPPSAPSPAAASHACSRLDQLPRPKLSPLQSVVYQSLLDMGFEELFALHAANNAATVDDAVSFDGEAFLQRHREPSGRDGTKTDPVVDRFHGHEEEYDSASDQRKMVPFTAGDGFLLYVVNTLRKRLVSSSDFCVICDQPHVFRGVAMMRAAVCSRSVCVFAFQELSVGSDSAESVAMEAGVIDLLIRIFRAAALSDRADKILDPFPHVMHPTRREETVFDPKKRDVKKVKKTLEEFPSVSDVLGCNSLGSLRTDLDRRNETVFPLLEWIINSNRSHLVKIDEAHHIAKLCTRHQFLLVTAPPERQQRFIELKRKHGTKFAFHGSKIENWHAILRNGLKNCSGTSLQVNGAAHGGGIYFATQAGTSIGYSGGNGSPAAAAQQGVQQGLIGDGVICLALCEIVTDGIKDHGWCWTVVDEERVMTRVFLVYDASNATSGAMQIEANSADFVKEVDATLTYYGVS